jgi:hypothetical protein
MGEADDPEISVDVDVTMTGTLSVRMKLSEARELGKKLDDRGEVDLDDVHGFDWGEAVNLMDGVVDGVDFDDDPPSEKV